MEHRPRLTAEEFEIIKAWRERGTLPQLFEECKAAGIEIKDVRHFWHKSKKFSIFAKRDTPSLDKLFAPILADLREYSPTFDRIERQPVDQPHLLVIGPLMFMLANFALLMRAAKRTTSTRRWHRLTRVLTAFGEIIGVCHRPGRVRYWQ